MNTTDDNMTPVYATGPDCFENEDHRESVETDRFIAADDTVPAYLVGDLHLLANAIERFQTHHRLLFKPDLDDLHGKLAEIINWADERTLWTDTPVQSQALRRGRCS